MVDDNILQVRAELARRIGAIERRGAPAAIAGEIDTIRRLAHRNGMLPTVTVAQLLGSALARGEQGALVNGWLGMLSEAIGCERQDVAASDVFAAACQVRFAV